MLSLGHPNDVRNEPDVQCAFGCLADVHGLSCAMWDLSLSIKTKFNKLSSCASFVNIDWLVLATTEDYLGRHSANTLKDNA